MKQLLNYPTTSGSIVTQLFSRLSHQKLHIHPRLSGLAAALCILLFFPSMYALSQEYRIVGNKRVYYGPTQNCLLVNKPNEDNCIPTNSDGIPMVKLGRINGSQTCKELILRDPRLIPQDDRWHVTAFTFSMTSGDRSWGPVYVTGANLTDEIKDKIRDWDMPGMKIYLDNIHIRHNGIDRFADPVRVSYNY